DNARAPPQRPPGPPRAPPRVAPRFDPAKLAVPGITSGTCFNGSLLRFGGRLIFAYRIGWAGGTDIAITELTTRYDVRRVIRLPLYHGKATVGREDPRPFVHEGRLHVAFVGVTWSLGKEGTPGELAINQ